MNELQVRLSADIKQLQSALSRAKKTIKDFETETEKGSERSNVGFRRKIGLIEQLENRAKRLRIALRHATSEEQVERYNKELNQTVSEMSRLNALGRQVGGSISQTGAAFKKTGGSIVYTNGVALEFNRIIQDSPYAMNNFGSIANNMQQAMGNLTAQFQKGVPASVVWKSLIQSLVSPMNLALLGISALTAGFTAYQMGAFDFLKSNKDAKDELEKFNQELDEFRDNLDAVASARVKGSSDAAKEIAELNALQKQAQNVNAEMDVRLSAVRQLQSKYPEYFGNLSEEAILTGDVGDANARLTTQLLGRAKVQAALNEIGERSLDILTIEERIQQRILDILNLQNKAEALKIKLSQQRAAGSAGPGAAAGQGIIRSIANIEEEITSLGKEQVKDVESLNKLKQKTASQEDFINGLLGDGVKLNEDQKKAVESVVKETTKQITELERLSQLYSDILDNLNKIEKAGLLKGKGGIIDFGVEVGDVPPVQERADETPESLVKLRQQELDLLERAGVEIKNIELLSEDQILAYKDQAGQLLKIDMLSQQIGQTLSGSFEDAILKGEDLFDSLEKGFKRLLAKLAAQLIASTILKVLGSIIGGPAGGIIGSGLGSGVGGLLSGGGSIGSNFSSLGAGIASVPNMPSSPSIAASTGAMVAQKVDVNVYGEIMNDRIVLSNARGKRENGRFYGING